ncbi:MAG: M28 family peptidase [Flavisolibacter sp.]
MKKLLFIVLALSTLQGFAQKKSVNPEPYGKTITAADLRRHLYIVASKEMGGRETGTEGERKAAAYIENEFRRIGLLPANNGSYQLPYHLYQDSLTHAVLEINGQKFEEDKDFNASLASYAATLRMSEVVVVGNQPADSIKNMNLAGKLVLLLGSPQQGRGNNALQTALLNKGVAGILTVTSGFPKKTPVVRKGRQGIYSFQRTALPLQFTISEHVAQALLGNKSEEAKSLSKGVLSLRVNVLMEMEKTTVATPTSNVMGILPGTDLKDEYLFITAHHDHIGKRGDSIINYGADDDGSGTVSVIEIAEAFAHAKLKGKGPRRSIVFMTVSGEEKGLLGSEFYSNQPVYPLGKTTANLNIDMIGRMDPSRKHGDSTNYVYVVGDDKLSSDLRPISESVNKKYGKLELDYKFNEPKDPMRIYYRSDHYNFAKHGVPIIFYFNGTHADYHRPGDTPDKINYTLLAKRARFVFYTAWEMANRNEMLKRDIPLDNSVFNR